MLLVLKQGRLLLLFLIFFVVDALLVGMENKTFV